MTSPSTEGWRPPTDTELAEIVETAYQMGLDGDEYDEESRTIDWHRIVDKFEEHPIDLGDSMNGPAVKAILKAYRKGRKDAAL